MRQPTAEECTAEATVDLGDGRTGTACWWPQMGGYSGRAVAVPDEDEHVDLYVWHDGQFPFDGACQFCRTDREPVKLHLCAPEHFVDFFRFLASLEQPSDLESLQNSEAPE